MPYIVREKREVLDPIIEDLINALRGLQSDDPTDNAQANMSYVISRVLDRMYVADYQEINNALGMLFASALEYYRRVGAPYENQKAFENDDVYELNTAQKFLDKFVGEQKDDDD
jgi:hypothetical protein